MVSVAMKAGTLSQVTSTPLIRPTARPTPRQTSTAAQAGRSKWVGAKAIENTTATRPSVEPTERSRSRLAMTKVMPTAITP